MKSFASFGWRIFPSSKRPQTKPVRLHGPPRTTPSPHRGQKTPHCSTSRTAWEKSADNITIWSSTDPKSAAAPFASITARCSARFCRFWRSTPVNSITCSRPWKADVPRTAESHWAWIGWSVFTPAWRASAMWLPFPRPRQATISWARRRVVCRRISWTFTISHAQKTPPRWMRGMIPRLGSNFSLMPKWKRKWNCDVGRFSVLPFYFFLCSYECYQNGLAQIEKCVQ